MFNLNLQLSCDCIIFSSSPNLFWYKYIIQRRTPNWNSMRLPRFSNYNWLISVRHNNSCVFLCLKGATAYRISIATNSCYVTWRIVKEILTYTLGRGAQRTWALFPLYLTSRSAHHILSVPSQLSAFHKPK